MNDMLEFILQLKDLASGGMQKFSQTSIAALAAVDQRVNVMQKDIDMLASRLTSLASTSGSSFGGMNNHIGGSSRQVQGLEQDVNDLNEALRKTRDASNIPINVNAGMPTIAGGAFMGNLASQAAIEGFREVKRIGEEALNYGASAEQQMIGLATFVGKDQSKSIYRDIQQSSAYTPYTTQQILPGMLQLMASGETPQRSKHDLWSLMNALSATGNAGNGFALELGESHLSQMAAQGSVDATFMREFQRTLHIPMTKLLSEYMHVSMKQIAEWMENGDLKQHVTFDQFMGSLDQAALPGGMFPNALENQSQSIMGKWSTIKDNYQNSLANSVLEPERYKEIKDMEDGLIAFTKNLPENIEKIISVVKLAGEAFIAWKAITLLNTGANQLMNMSLAQTATDYQLANAAMAEQESMMAAQVAEVDALTVSYTEARTALIAWADSGIAAQISLSGAVAKNSLAGIAAGTSAAAAGLAGGFAGAVTTSVIPVAIAYFTGEAVSQMLGKGAFGYKENGDAIDWYNLADKNEMVKRLAAQERQLEAYSQQRPNGMRSATDLANMYHFSPYMPVQTPYAAPYTLKGENINLKGVDDAVKNITGGGQKVVNINIRSFVEHMENHFKDAKEGAEWSEKTFTEMMLRAVRSIDQSA
jgi:hypothetical protein